MNDSYSSITTNPYILLVSTFHMRLSDFPVARCTTTTIDVTVAKIELHSVYVSIHYENSCCKERTVDRIQSISV